MELDDFLSRLHGVKRVGNRVMALCPAHDDNDPSLDVAVKDGRILLHCYAGCSFEAILEALGLESRDLVVNGNSNGSEKPQVVATYDYRDEAGRVLFRVVRYRPKAFRQCRPDGHGGWVWGLGNVRRVLYHLDEIVKRPNETVYIVEGEKDADRLASLGLLATCSPMGAGKWRDEYAESLQGRRVIIIPDNDEPGKAHAHDVLQSLRGVASEVRVVALPGVPEHGDVSNWLDAGGDVGALEQLSTEPTVMASSKIVRASDLLAHDFPPPEFLPFLGLDGYIIRGWTTLVAGYPKAGKTELMTWLCSEWPSEHILYITEEPEAIWAHRLRQLGGGWHNLSLLFGLGLEVSEIYDEIERFDEATVVVIDTVRNLLRLQDETDNSEIARVLSPFIKLCRDNDKTLLLLHHIRKGGGEYGEGITGGHAFLGIVDTALELLRENGGGDSRRRVRGWGRIFQIEDVIIEMGEDGQIRPLGAPSQVELENVKSRVLAVLTDEFAKLRSIYELLGEPQPSMGIIREALNALIDEGLVERDPKDDRRGATYLYRLA